MELMNDKHIKMRIESWCKKFCQITTNINWKKNRNLHAIFLLNMIINQNFEPPYTKFPPEGPLPILSKPLIKASLSPKFNNYLSNYCKLSLSQKKQRAFSNDSFNNIGMNMSGKIKRPITPGEITFKDTNSNNKNHLDEINKCNDADLLKKYIEKLENKVNETRKIINENNEEKKILLKKINQLESILKSYKI